MSLGDDDNKNDNNNKNNHTDSHNNRHRQFNAKIAPPALGGKKVGIFATRTPHRPNPIGFTLVKVDSIVRPSKSRKDKGKGKSYSINISGLDLVDGTPVLDIKPYVPHYDSVGYPAQGKESGVETNAMANEVRVPDWVSEGLTKRKNVIFSSQAKADLESIAMLDSTDGNGTSTRGGLQFYGVSSGRDATPEEALAAIRFCIVEVLSVDVRSEWQTKKARKGRYRAERADRLREVVKSGCDKSSTEEMDVSADVDLDVDGLENDGD